MLWRRKRSLGDFREEIESHLALEADEVRAAAPSLDSDAAARRAFGNVMALEEKWHEQSHWMFFDCLTRDLLQALRQIRRKPGFCLIVILTLALGIGANAAIFSIVEAVLLRPLPYKDPARLAMLFSEDPARQVHEGRVSLLNYSDWRSQSRGFDDMTAYIAQTFLLRTEGLPERMRSARVGANFWPLLGVEPLLGRVFTEEEEKRGDRVAVLSYPLWQQLFGGRREAVGSRLTMDDRSYLVIGVMPRDFRFPFADTKVWEPVTAHPYWSTRDRKNPRSDSLWLVLGRVKKSVSWTQAQDEMDGIARRLRAEHPGEPMPASIPVVPLSVQTAGRFRLSLWLLLGSVFLMLLIACINVAGLLLARQTLREREFAIRRALGAGRLRIAGQVMTETLVLAICGGLLGLLAASGGVAAIRAFGPADIPRLGEARLDGTVIAFAALLTGFSAILASAWPAVETGGTRVGSRQWISSSTRRAGDLLVVAEFALALILVASASLLIHSFLRMRAVEMGYRPDHLLSMRVDLHVGRSSDRLADYFEEAIRRAEAVPGVRSAGAISGFLRTDPEDSVHVEGLPPQHPGPCEDFISGAFFSTAEVPLRKGRFFSDRDRRDSLPVAIVNEAMERAYWPRMDALGKRFRFSDSKPWLTVVGVTGDMRRGMDRSIAPQVFLPQRQGSEDMMDIIVRTSSEPATLARAVQKQVEGVDRTVAQFRVTTVTQELGEETGDRQFDAFLVGSFAAGALFLAAIGIYGLLHHSVAQRTNEIGLRMALGARPGAVRALILRKGLRLAAIGAGAGLVGSVLAARLLAKLLFEVAPTDPLTLALSVFALIAVAAAACWIPSRRAARIDPMRALRQD